MAAALTSNTSNKTRQHVSGSLESFRFSVVKRKLKEAQRPITTKEDFKSDQSELKVNPSNQVRIGFSFVSNWLGR